MENKDKMIKTNVWIGVENLDQIEEVLGDSQFKYSDILEALENACKKQGLSITSQKVAVNQTYKSFWGLIEVHGGGTYNPVLSIQMNWGSSNIKLKWGCHFKEEDIYSFPINEIKGSNTHLRGITAIVEDHDKWLLKIEETFEFLSNVEVSRSDIWNVYMFQLAYVLKVIPSSIIIPLMQEWDESGEISLHSFYMTLCRKVSGKEPNVLISFHEKLQKSNYFNQSSPIEKVAPSNNATFIEDTKEEEEEDMEDFTEEEDIEEEEEEEGLAIANKYL